MLEEWKHLLQDEMSIQYRLRNFWITYSFEYSWELRIAEFLATQPSDLQMWLEAYIKLIINKNLDFKVYVCSHRSTLVSYTKESVYEKITSGKVTWKIFLICH